MSSLFQLIQNEHAKLFKLKSTWLMFVLLISIVIIAGYLDFRYERLNDSSMEATTMWTFISFLENTSLLIALFTISIASSILPKEFSMGTIKFLMIRPASRTKILLSKYVTILSLMILFYLTLLGISLLVGLIVHGLEPQTNVTAFLETLKTYGYGAIQVLIFATLAFMLSVLTRSTSIAAGMTIPLFFIGSTLNLLILKYEWSRYSLFSNLDLEIYATGAPMKEGMTFGFSLTVLAVYFMLFVTIAFVSFNKRDIV